jgi:uncharacterized protein
VVVVTSTSTGFHEGELAVQQRAGVRGEATRLAGMLAPPRLDGGTHRFLAARDVAVLAGRDRDGRLWASPLLGSPGFLDAHGTTLRVHATPAAGDPLANLPAEQPVGLIAIDLAARRRMRVNGTLTAAADGELVIAAEQAYGNCPQYIQQRHVDHRPPTADAGTARWSTTMDQAQTALVERADTFFLGTTHPTRGTDVSHRGGAPGFVRVDGATLWWPDYPGNNLFNSFGNLAVDDSAALLFVDFDTGATLHLSGTATVEWITPGAPGDDGGTGRRVRYTPRHVVSATVPLRSRDLIPSPYNPRRTA